ncbi:uncharacterized protein LOC110046716 isoform X2 [Orbicella faveolata]|uniref:uncharacterized protein LOC110046716 isoform X2 n=1 Tax=Orbicella faveolata TaxID=48498 RepID=UPI0009E33D05|nr:uncharacterized protein LOC110046716 isoform X2 [Orbicella faveolata]
MVKLTDIFRSLFGAPKEQLGTNDLPRDIQEDLENLYGRRQDLNYWQPELPAIREEWRLFNDQPLELGDHEDYFHSREGDFLQEFEQMFHNIFRGFQFDFNPPAQDLPTIDLLPDNLPSEMSEENFPKDSGSLRERMLKGPDSSLDSENFKDEDDNKSEGFPLFPPFSLFSDLWKLPPFSGLRCPDERVDRAQADKVLNGPRLSLFCCDTGSIQDLDNEVEMGTHSLDEILAAKDEGQMSQHVPCFSSSSSFSSVTIVDSNGVTEKRTTRRDSSGNEEVTITRRIGDQTRTVTRRKDNHGHEETQVDTVNIDKDDIKKCRHSQSRDVSEFFRHPTPLSSIYDSVLEQFFPKRR